MADKPPGAAHDVSYRGYGLMLASWVILHSELYVVHCHSFT